ncbi:MAG: trypsin-like peptidase domain-containing protein [Alphaproteobacteria bacterium]|nr:trypsin-like peptidase domain-containing protein [Alphaproteobacteria bacterium]
MRYFLILLGFFISAHHAMAVESYADLVERLIPSVVNISTENTIIDETEKVDNLMLNPELKGRESLGSGFFIRRDGYILTNYHVVKEAKTVSVITNDGKNYAAKIIGSDVASDLTVLKIDIQKDAKEEFQPINFGNADVSRIGDIVLTFGNPYGLGASVSQGIISAKSRSIGLGEQQYIQTDAAINQGNSGGPMFNLDGEVIGINTAVFKMNGATGVGFALPSNIANWISTQLISYGKVKRGWIGINVAAGIDKYTGKSGFVITEIDEESNAYKDGLRVGDIIIAYNDKVASDINAFAIFTETMEPGQTLRLKILSLGEEIKKTIHVQDMPSHTLKDVTNKALEETAKYYHQDADNDVFYVSELNIAVKEAKPRGLMIVKMERKSPLSDKGIKEGDVILEADRAEVYSVDNLLENIRNAIVDDFRPISLLIQSLDNTFYVDVKVLAEDD